MCNNLQHKRVCQHINTDLHFDNTVKAYTTSVNKGMIVCSY